MDSSTSLIFCSYGISTHTCIPRKKLSECMNVGIRIAVFNNNSLH
jgi:hypothetical protein